MAQLTQTDIASVVKEMNAFYQPGEGKCVATPKQVSKLLEKLKEYTEEVQQEAQDQGLDDDTNVSQWAIDMANWQQRLAAYMAALAGVPKAEWDTPEGCAMIYETVTAPLLDGIYYTAAPGVVLDADELARIGAGEGHPTTDVVTHEHPAGHSNAKPNDVATPFSLGNQVLVYKEWQAERWRLFWEDLYEEAKRLARKAIEVASSAVKVVPWVVGGAVVIALVAGGIVISRRRALKRSRKAA